VIHLIFLIAVIFLQSRQSLNPENHGSDIYGAKLGAYFEKVNTSRVANPCQRPANPCHPAEYWKIHGFLYIPLLSDYLYVGKSVWIFIGMNNPADIFTDINFYK
jgi:hypothetical protein